MAIQHINPDGMYKSPVFSQGIVLPANARILLIGGQNGVNEKGEIVGKGDVAKQAEQAITNLITVLEAAGAGLEHLVKTTVLIHVDADMQAAYGPWMKAWGQRPNPPLVTSMRVAGLANPDFLIEIEAQAVLP
jgi:enamine deaminase RidA (YjgF/YER057c/UK114 family)